ncbi:MAG: CPBP family glutamic-type intramembrane protease [Candidatus Pacearchaeota archaeon]
MANKQDIKSTILLLITTSVLLGILIAGNNSLLSLLSVYIAFIIISIVAYYNNDFKKDLILLSKKNLGYSIIFAVVLSGFFYLIVKFIPYFSLGLPIVPNAIADSLKTIIIIIFAPIVESVFFQSVVYVLLLNLFKSKSFAFIGQAFLFALAHVSAYVTGFYNYPEFTQGLTAVYANIGAFLSAFLFAIIGMFFLLRDKINNLAFIITFHALMNLIILTSLVVVFG